MWKIAASNSVKMVNTSKRFQYAVKLLNRDLRSPIQSRLDVYGLGRGIRQDYAKAIKWHRKAAEQGFAGAQGNLGVMYANGEGVRRSGAVAADWYYKAGLSYLKEGKKMMC